MDLLRWLDDNRDAEYQRVESIRAAVSVIWATPLHRYYTDHSVAHSERVIDKLAVLVPFTTAEDLSPLEAYILLASSYLHDIGMQHERFRDGDLEQIREQHHELTRRIIEDNYLSLNGAVLPLGLESVPRDIVDIIAAVAEAHRKTDLCQSKYRRIFRDQRPVRPRLLAALLRLADELDLDHNRVNMKLLYLMKVPPLSCLHWYLCHYVSGVEIQDGYVTIWYRFPQGCEHYESIIIPLVRHRVETELGQLQPILWKYSVKVTMDPRDEVHMVSGLEPMPPQVEQLARDQCRGSYEEGIAKFSEEIRLLESFESTYEPDSEHVYE